MLEFISTPEIVRVFMIIIGNSIMNHPLRIYKSDLESLYKFYHVLKLNIKRIVFPSPRPCFK